MAHRSQALKVEASPLQVRVTNAFSAFASARFSNVVRVGRSSIALQRNAKRILEDAEEAHRPSPRKSIHFDNYEQRLSVILSPKHSNHSSHWTVLMRDLTIEHDMDEFLIKLRASKLRAMGLKTRLVKAVRRLILQRAVQRMKKRLDEYNQAQKSRQTLLKMQYDQSKKRRGSLSKKKKPRDSFHDFWRGMRKMRADMNVGNKFDDEIQNELLSRWMEQHHLSSTVWSMFDKEEIDRLFKSMEWDIKVWNYGTAIFKKGDQGKYFYTILDGEISLWILKEGIDTNLTTNSNTLSNTGNTDKSVLQKVAEKTIKGKLDGVNQTPIREIDAKTQTEEAVKPAHVAHQGHQQQGKWEKIMTLQTPVSFGELALFPNGTGVRNASCVARNQCLMLLIDKENYLRFIHERIMKSRNEKARIYTHFKRSSSTKNLEKLVIIASIAIEQLVEPLHVAIPDRIHAAKDDIHFDKQSVYVIKRGIVGLCFSSEKKRDLTLCRGRANAWSSQLPFLELGPGSIIDCRVLYEVGMRRFGSSGIDGFEQFGTDQMRDYDRIYYIAKTQVTLQKFKLNSFVQIGNFDLFSLCRVAKMELYLVMERYNEHKRKMVEKERKQKMNRGEMKGVIRKRRLQDPGILGSSLFDKSPLELYKMKMCKMNGTESREMRTSVGGEDESEGQSEERLSVPLNLTGTLNADYTPLPAPLKIIRVPRNELPSIFM